MNYQIDNFYHNNSPSRNLDKNINPFVQHIVHNHIGSIHQLQNHIQKYHHQHYQIQPVKQFNQTISIFKQPIINKQPSYHKQKYKKIMVKHNQLYERRNISSLDKVQKLHENPEERIIIVNDCSKIKKHLIESINIDQMQKALFKKRQTINRFEQFCLKLKARDIATRSKINSRNFTNKVSQLSHRSKIKSFNATQQFKPRSTFSKTFRISSKRNMWNFIYDQPIQAEPFRIKKISRTIDKI